MGMLAARIRKQDQVNGDTVLVQPNEKGGAVRTAAIGNNIDMLTSFQKASLSLLYSVFNLPNKNFSDKQRSYTIIDQSVYDEWWIE